MRGKYLVGVVLLLGAATYLVLKTGNEALRNDASGRFAQSLASAQLEFESCLFGGRGSQDWGAGAAEGLLGNPELWRSCVDPLVEAADRAHRDSGSGVPAIERYQATLRELHYELPGADRRQPKEVCLAAARLRDAFIGIGSSAEQTVQAQEQPQCGPRAEPLASVLGAAEGDELVTIWRSEPTLVGRFRRAEGEQHAYAAYRDDSWNALPLPSNAVDEAFEPMGPTAILRGSPQTVVRYDQGSWVEVGVGPKAGSLRYLRGTSEQGLMALAEDFDAGQFYALRSASLSAPFDAPISLATPSLPKGHECAAPLLQVDNTMLVVCSVPSAKDRQLIVLRLAAGDVLAKRTTIAAGDAEQPEIVACHDPQRLWIRWGSFAERQTVIFRSEDGGQSFVDVGRVPEGGTAMCRGQDLLWLGFNDTGDAQIANCALTANSCSTPLVMGGDQVWRSLDGARLALVANEAGFAAIFDLGGTGPLRASAYSLFPIRTIGLRNLRKSGATLFERVAQR